jgi:hypothetical protein
VDVEETKQALAEWHENRAAADESAVARADARNRVLRERAAAQLDDGGTAQAAPDPTSRDRIDALRSWGSRAIEVRA